VHLVGFIIRIYHDAQPPESQTFLLVSMFMLYPQGVSYYVG